MPIQRIPWESHPPRESLGPLGRITNLDLSHTKGPKDSFGGFLWNEFRIMPKEAKKKAVFASQTEDYYLYENNKLVFTEYYLLKRGYCCQNGCRHCPYGFEK